MLAHASATEPQRLLRFATRISDAYGLVLLLVVATYAAMSVLSYTGWSGVVIWLVAGSCGVVALASAGSGPHVVRAGAVVAAASVTFACTAAAADSSTSSATAALLEMLLLAVAAAAVLRTVLEESKVGFRTILGAISVYVLIGLLFTFVYVALERLQAGLFFGQMTHTGDFAFFSITTLTSTGYGNLVPAAQPGKMLSGLEMLTGQIFLVTLIAGLVAQWRPGARLPHHD